MGKAWASCCGVCSAVDRGRGSQVESMASRRKMLIEILNYSGFISGDRVSYPQCSGQLEGGALIFHGLYTVSQKLFEFVLQKANFCLKMLALAFLTACVYLFLTSLKSCISRGLFDANAERHGIFLCWLRAVRSGENQGLYLLLVLNF